MTHASSDARAMPQRLETDELVLVAPVWNTSPRAMDARPRTFEEFFEAEKDGLFRALCLITGSRQEAEDVAQEAFVKIWERWDRVGAMDNPAGYLHRSALNTYRSRYRRAMVAARRAVRMTPHPDVFETVEDREVVAQMLAGLTPRQRAAVVLTEALGYSAEEAGKILRVKGSTIRVLNFQARSALRAATGVAHE